MPQHLKGTVCITAPFSVIEKKCKIWELLKKTETEIAKNKNNQIANIQYILQKLR